MQNRKVLVMPGCPTCETMKKNGLCKEDGIRHALPDLALAQELGFKLQNLTKVSCELLDQFPEGESVEEMLMEGMEELPITTQ